MERSGGPSPSTRPRRWRRFWLALGAGLLAALAALAELSGAQPPVSLRTAALWITVAIGSLLAALLEWLTNQREDRAAWRAAQEAAEQQSTEEERRWAERLDDDFLAHWEPRHRGVEHHEQPGWFFTGRSHALQQLVSWLDNPDDRTARVVTGPPGSGKSAVLAWLVTLSNPRRMQQAPTAVSEVTAPQGTVPRPGSIDLAVHAKGRTPQELVDFISRAVGLSLKDEPSRAKDDFGPLVDALLQHGRPMVVVVDALDEAIQPQRVAREFLEPLATRGGRVGVRLLVGTRPQLLGLLGPSFKRLDLDRPPYLETADVARYVERLLQSAEEGPANPYRNQAALRRRVADAVAARAAGNFLVAQLTSRALLAAGEVIELDEPDWPARLPNTVGTAMDHLLAAFGEQEPRIRDLLRPLAYVQARGLADDQVWAALATATAATPGPHPYTDRDARWLRTTLAANLLERVHVPFEDRIGFRLFHQALAEHLRADGDDERINASYTEALCTLVPSSADSSQRNWLSAPGYVRHHLADHALRAGGDWLEKLVRDPQFLLGADPESLRDTLLEARSSTSAPAVTEAAWTFQWAPRTLLETAQELRVSLVELEARKCGADRLADLIDRSGFERPWSVPLARWKHGFRNPRGPTSFVSLATGEVDGRPIVAVSSFVEDPVWIWNLDSGDLTGAPLIVPGGVGAVEAVGELDGNAAVVVRENDHALHVWDLDRRRRIGAPLPDYNGGFEFQPDDVKSVAALSQHLLAAVAIRHDELSSTRWHEMIKVFDLPARAVVGQPIVVPYGVQAVQVVEFEGRQLVVTLCHHEHPVVWDLASGALLCKLEPPPLSDRYRSFATEHMAVAAHAGRLVVAGISDDFGFGWVWILTDKSLIETSSSSLSARLLPGSGLSLERPLSDSWQRHLLSAPLAVGAVDDRITVAAGSDEYGVVGLWDLDEGLVSSIRTYCPLTDMQFAAPDFHAIGAEFGFIILKVHRQYGRRPWAMSSHGRR